jgi:hypothetical protein
MKKTQTNNISLRSIGQNRRMYFLFNHLGIKDDIKQDLALEYSNNRTDKTSELYYIEAQELINSLEKLLRKERKQQFGNNMDKKRKGVIKAIFAWYEAQGRKVSMEYVKATACRAANEEHFNKISGAALTRIYAEFCRKQSAQKTMKELCIDVSKN